MDESSYDAPALTTARVVLRPWRPSEAAVLRALWADRDPRVPSHRRIDADGHPTVAELSDSIRTGRASASAGILAIERRADGVVVGYCGLVGAEPGQVPELVFELDRAHRGQGYAGEVAEAVLDHARAIGHRQVRATVSDWNTASRRLLARLGFTEGAVDDGSEASGPARTTLVTTIEL